jgi:cysteine desulfurase/selenocysteine lyase
MGGGVMPDKFLKVRKQFAITRNYTYLNHAAVSPFARPVADAMRQQIEERSKYGGRAEDRWEERAEQARKQAARLLGAKPAEIAFVTNTTQGLNLFGRGVAWRRGDNVVLPRVEFPANVYPWLALKELGVSVKFVPERDGRIRVEDIERAIDRHTRIVAISFVEFSSGYRNDLARIGKICKSMDVFLVVDGIQGVGALNLDVRRAGIDGLSCGGHKWLLAPQGTGLFYCSSKVLKNLKHPMPGWLSVVGWENYYEFDYKLFPDSRRYESAQKNLHGATGLGAALRMINELGISDIEQRILGLTDHLCMLLEDRGFRVFSPRGPGEKSGIVSFYPGKHGAEKVCQRLLRKGFVTCARQGRIRVSPHFYNTPEEIESLVRALPR